MLARIAIGAGLLACSAAAAAEDWRLVSADDDSVQFVDADSIVRADGRVRFTREIRWHDVHTADGFRFDRVVQLAEVSCGERLLFPLGTVALLGEDSVHSDGPYDDAEEMLPGTNLGGTHDGVCSGRFESGTVADRAAFARGIRGRSGK